jgi:hypothetical protein
MDCIENEVSNNSSIVACVFDTMVNIFTESLPSKDKGFMKWAHVPCTYQASQRLVQAFKVDGGRGGTHAHRQQSDLISLFLFFQKESKLKLMY